MPIWTFVRHGESQANRDGWFAGHTDSPLTASGRAHAGAARRQLRDVAFTRAVCSDLTRAHHTARILLEDSDVPLTVTADLRERCMGAWEGRLIAEIAASGELEHCLRHWRCVPPQGESLRDTALRASSCLAALDAEIDTLVVCHGALMRALIGALDRRPRDQLGTWRPGNCEFVERTVAVGAWQQLHEEIRAEAQAPPSK